jgi:MICOS complex subunit MIC19
MCQLHADLTCCQSDTTRSANVEWKIQSRVTSELEKISSSESSRLKSLTDAVSSGTDESQSRSRFFANVPFIGEPETKPQTSHTTVSKEIEDLKQKMDKRKKLDQVDPAAEQARADLVQCLRTHDRRPLDCWKEREAFKREVGRMEKQFVERTIR